MKSINPYKVNQAVTMVNEFRPLYLFRGRKYLVKKIINAELLELKECHVNVHINHLLPYSETLEKIYCDHEKETKSK